MQSTHIVLIVIAALFTASFPLTALAEAWGASRKRKGAEADQIQLMAIDARLSRMEDAIESVAVEMERIAEGQRFTARLLSERSAPSAQTAAPRPAQSSDPRHVTPH